MTTLFLTFTAPGAVTLTQGETLVLGFPAPQGVELAAVGMQGASGGGSGGYTHVQSVAATTWSINHNLGRRPQVEVFTPGWVQVEAEVVHLSDNQTQISFNTAQTGQAVFS